jgi:hypothetical protein
MCGIQKVVFIYFAIIIFTAMWGDGQMVKPLGCGQQNGGSNPILDMYFYWFFIWWL